MSNPRCSSSIYSVRVGQRYDLRHVVRSSLSTRCSAQCPCAHVQSCCSDVCWDSNLVFITGIGSRFRFPDPPLNICLPFPNSFVFSLCVCARHAGGPPPATTYILRSYDDRLLKPMLKVSSRVINNPSKALLHFFLPKSSNEGVHRFVGLLKVPQKYFGWAQYYILSVPPLLRLIYYPGVLK